VTTLCMLADNALLNIPNENDQYQFFCLHQPPQCLLPLWYTVNFIKAYS